MKFLLYYGTIGLIVTFEYWLIWRGPPHVRHGLCWPLLATCQVARIAPPRWLKPAPADLEAQAADGWTRG